MDRHIYFWPDDQRSMVYVGLTGERKDGAQRLSRLLPGRPEIKGVRHYRLANCSHDEARLVERDVRLSLQAKGRRIDEGDPAAKSGRAFAIDPKKALWVTVAALKRSGRYEPAPKGS